MEDKNTEKDIKIVEITDNIMRGFMPYLNTPLYYTVEKDGCIGRFPTALGEKFEQVIIKELNKSI